MVKISSDNTVRVTITDNSSSLNLGTNNSNIVTNTIKLNSNSNKIDKLAMANSQAKYFSDLAQESAEEAKKQAETAEYWAGQATAGQIQANWNETNPESKAYIQNKPENISDFNNDMGYLTEHQDISGYALKTEIPINNNQLINGAEYQTSSDVESIVEPINTELSTKLNKNQITNCILEAPNGIVTYSGNTFTVHQGLKFLSADGLNADGNLKNTEVTLEDDVIKEITEVKPDLHVLYLSKVSNSDWYISFRQFSSQWVYGQTSGPSSSMTYGHWYNPSTNLWQYRSGSTTWLPTNTLPLGLFTTDSNKNINYWKPFASPINILKESDIYRFSSLSCPTTKKITLADASLPGTGTSITLPADGYLYLIGITDLNTNLSQMYLQFSANGNLYRAQYSGALLIGSFYFEKGTVIHNLSCTSTVTKYGSTPMAQFIYAKGGI